MTFERREMMQISTSLSKIRPIFSGRVTQDLWVLTVDFVLKISNHYGGSSARILAFRKYAITMSAEDLSIPDTESTVAAWRRRFKDIFCQEKMLNVVSIALQKFGNCFALCEKVPPLHNSIFSYQSRKVSVITFSDSSMNLKQFRLRIWSSLCLARTFF